MTADLFYCYGVVESGSEGHKRLAAGEVPGMEDDRPLFPVEAGGLVAAVSRVPAERFQEEPLNTLLTQLPLLAPYALRHHEAIAALLPGTPAVIPMTLGTVYKSVENVQEMLAERTGELKGTLGRLRGKREWGVKVFAETAKVLGVAGEESPRLRALDQEAAAVSPGKSYLVKKQRDRLLANEADRLLAETLEKVVARLKKASSDLVVEQLPPAATVGTARLVLKASALVHLGALDAFQEAVAEMQREQEARGLSLDLDGPWAPYSFVGERRVLA